jgi:hypothetical protein
MELLSYDRYYAAIEAETARIAEVAASADLAAPVPTCPGWTLTKLVTHVGRVVWEHGHGKADVAVRGTAADLLLMLYRRPPPGSRSWVTKVSSPTGLTTAHSDMSDMWDKRECAPINVPSMSRIYRLE